MRRVIIRWKSSPLRLARALVQSQPTAIGLQRALIQSQTSTVREQRLPVRSRCGLVRQQRGPVCTHVMLERARRRGDAERSAPNAYPRACGVEQCACGAEHSGWPPARATGDGEHVRRPLHARGPGKNTACRASHGAWAIETRARGAHIGPHPTDIGGGGRPHKLGAMQHTAAGISHSAEATSHGAGGTGNSPSATAHKPGGTRPAQSAAQR